MERLENKARLKQEVMNKIRIEYEDFIDEVADLNDPKDIIDKSYEKVCKEEMIYYFEEKNLSTKECKALLKSQNILQECYDEWLKSDGNFNELFEYSTDKRINIIVNDYQKRISQKAER